MKSVNGKILTLICLVYFLSHLIGIADPPSGFHAWRESDTAAVNESYAKETLNIFYPRVHQRENKSGITGMEFPVYNFITGIILRILPDSAVTLHLIPRLLSTLFGVLAIIGIFRIGSNLFNEKTALIAAFLLACSPVFFFYSRKIQPDTLMLTSVIWALYYFLTSIQQNKLIPLAISTVLTSIAALIKPTSLFIGIPYIYIIYNENKNFKSLFSPKYLVSGAVILIATFWWNSHAKFLQTEFGLDSFYLGGNMIEYWANTNWPEFLHNIFLGWLFEMYLGLPAAVGLVFGLVYYRKLEKGIGLVLAWIAGSYIIFFLVSKHMAAFHDYYGLIAVPGLILLAAYAFEKLLSADKKFLNYLAIFFMLAAAVIGYMRVMHRYGEYKSDKFVASREFVDQHIPADALITIEDSSPAIELYRAGRFGWTFKPGAKTDVISSVKEDGAKYAVYNRSEPDSNMVKNYKLVAKDGKYIIFEL